VGDQVEEVAISRELGEELEPKLLDDGGGGDELVVLGAVLEQLRAEPARDEAEMRTLVSRTSLTTPS